MVSIVLPTYNGEKYIRESIQSIINQKFNNWELIVIDDCSTDSTNNIVSEFVSKDKRIKLYRNKKNLRLPASLNVGFAKTSGEYLTWTSDDNLYNPEALKKLVEQLEKDENCGLVFSRMEYIDKNGNNSRFSYEPHNIEEIYYHNIVNASFMYKREVYEDIGEYNTDRFLIEDYDYWLRIARKYKIKYIGDVLYKYRIHDESLTEVKNRQILEKKVMLLKEEIELTEHPDWIKRFIYKEIAESSFSLNKYDEMSKFIKKMKAIKPGLVDLRKAVLISYKIGPRLSYIMKKLLRRGL